MSLFVMMLMNDCLSPEMQHVSPEVNPHPSQEEEEDIKTPVELKIKVNCPATVNDFTLHTLLRKRLKVQAS